MPDTVDIAQKLSRCVDPIEQSSLITKLRSKSGYRRVLAACMRANPFLRVNEADLPLALSIEVHTGKEEAALLAARHQARQMEGLRIAILAMPKSGSSFTQSSVRRALNLNLANLTGAAVDNGTGSHLGINGRHQELDELALILAAQRHQGRWVSQTHTRYTPYLKAMLSFYGVRPIVIVRNIFDAIVSMDDMLSSLRDWRYDPHFALPSDFANLPRPERLRFLCRYYGHWLVDFNISWLRARKIDNLNALWLTFEEHVVRPERMANALRGYLDLDAADAIRIEDHCRVPDRHEARFNIGKIGRGSLIPLDAREQLVTYAAMFVHEIGEPDLKAMFFYRPSGA